MAWVDLSGAFGFGTKLTSTQQQNLRDNIAAAFAGDSGAPSLVRAALSTATEDETSTTAASGITITFASAADYGFFPQIKHNAGGGPTAQLFAAGAINDTTTFLTLMNLRSSSGTSTARVRYVTASGDVFWIWILRDKVTKEVLRVHTAPDHPAMATGDPETMPHAFPNGYDPAIHEIVCITSPRVDGKYGNWCEDIRKKAKATGKGVSEVVFDDYEVDEGTAPVWHDGLVTIGYDTDEDIMDLYHSGKGDKVPLKKVQIPQPLDVIHRSLKKKV